MRASDVSLTYIYERPLHLMLAHLVISRGLFLWEKQMSTLKVEQRRERGLYWDRAWKLVEGCTKVSLGCDNCWSESETAMRSAHPNDKISDRAIQVLTCAPHSEDLAFHGNVLQREDNLDLPMRVKKPTVFAIWNDLFHEEVTERFICDAYAMMMKCKQHTFLVLTKRSERLATFFSPENCFRAPNFKNIYHGVTICNQEEADRNIHLLLQVPGKRFLSIEPMLGPIDLRGLGVKCNQISETCGVTTRHACLLGNCSANECIHQVLLGGESGKNARPMHPEWVRTIRDQCDTDGVSFMLKQHGEWIVASDSNCVDSRKNWNPHNNDCLWLDTDGRIEPVSSLNLSNDCRAMIRAGKKKSGRTLDGKIHADLIWDK